MSEVVRLAVAFVDTSAAGLRWVLDDEPRPALAVRVVDVGDATLELRILGASHQVIVRDGAARLGEIVACDAGGIALPSTHASALGAHTYEMSSTVHHPSPSAVARLVRAASQHPTAVVAQFPDDGHAVTAIAVDGDLAAARGVRWRTWHAYPRTGELVVTHTNLRRR